MVGKMEIASVTPYEELRVTTMTLVVTLTNGVNILGAFHLLPVTRIEVPPPRGTTKCKLPHCPIPGAILSMRCRGAVRGIVRNLKDPFKNSVTIDISTTKKNISLKLSSHSVQICGASSRSDGTEAVEYILKHLTHAQRFLDQMQADPEKTAVTIAWIKEQCRGVLTTREGWEEQTFSNLVLQVQHDRPDNFLAEVVTPVPAGIDTALVRFLLSFLPDFLYYSDYCQKLDLIAGFPLVVSEPIAIDKVEDCMVNYNYSLGFEVERTALNELIDGRYGFVSRYNNALTSYAIVELPYEPSPTSHIKRRKSKVPHHTFLVYRSGSVTHSGPGGENMKGAYYLFMQAISELRPYIELSRDGSPSRSSEEWTSLETLRVA
jgi:hypothetical protein